MGSKLVALGFGLIVVGIGTFIWSAVGPSSKLWWPDRPGDWDRPMVRLFPAMIVVVGIILMIVGIATS